MRRIIRSILVFLCLSLLPAYAFPPTEHEYLPKAASLRHHTSFYQPLIDESTKKPFAYQVILPPYYVVCHLEGALFTLEQEEQQSVLAHRQLETGKMVHAWALKTDLVPYGLFKANEHLFLLSKLPQESKPQIQCIDPETGEIQKTIHLLSSYTTIRPLGLLKDNQTLLLECNNPIEPHHHITFLNLSSLCLQSHLLKGRTPHLIDGHYIETKEESSICQKVFFTHSLASPPSKFLRAQKDTPLWILGNIAKIG